MREQVDRLQKLTTDLLDLSRLDAGSIDLELEPVPLRTLANQVAGEFAAAAARKDSEIDVTDRESQLDIEAVCDPERVAQIVRVLIDNALVHTPDGTHITIAARRGAPGRRPGHRPAARQRRRPGHPPPRPGARLRALPHERLGIGLGPRARDRPRAGTAHARRPRGRLAARAARSSPSRCRWPASASSAPRPRSHASRTPRWAHDAPRARAAGSLALAGGLLGGCGGDGGRGQRHLDGRAHARAGGRGPRRQERLRSRRPSTSACRPAS